MPSELRDERLLKFAREMRKNMMPEERKLWYMYLQKHPSFRFRRQEIIGFYIADFYCAKARLVIEIDAHSILKKMQQHTTPTEQLSSSGKISASSVLPTPISTSVSQTYAKRLKVTCNNSSACAAGSPWDS